MKFKDVQLNEVFVLTNREKYGRFIKTKKTQLETAFSLYNRNTVIILDEDEVQVIGHLLIADSLKQRPLPYYCPKCKRYVPTQATEVEFFSDVQSEEWPTPSILCEECNLC
jgi:hypothetical protein